MAIRDSSSSNEDFLIQYTTTTDYFEQLGTFERGKKGYYNPAAQTLTVGTANGLYRTGLKVARCVIQNYSQSPIVQKGIAVLGYYVDMQGFLNGSEDINHWLSMAKNRSKFFTVDSLSQLDEKQLENLAKVTAIALLKITPLLETYQAEKAPIMKAIYQHTEKCAENARQAYTAKQIARFSNELDPAPKELAALYQDCDLNEAIERLQTWIDRSPTLVDHRTGRYNQLAKCILQPQESLEELMGRFGEILDSKAPELEPARQDAMRSNAYKKNAIYYGIVSSFAADEKGNPTKKGIYNVDECKLLIEDVTPGSKVGDTQRTAIEGAKAAWTKLKDTSWAKWFGIENYFNEKLRWSRDLGNFPKISNRMKFYSQNQIVKALEWNQLEHLTELTLIACQKLQPIVDYYMLQSTRKANEGTVCEKGDYIHQVLEDTYWCAKQIFTEYYLRQKSRLMYFNLSGKEIVPTNLNSLNSNESVDVSVRVNDLISLFRYQQGLIDEKLNAYNRVVFLFSRIKENPEAYNLEDVVESFQKLLLMPTIPVRQQEVIDEMQEPEEVVDVDPVGEQADIEIEKEKEPID